MKRLAHLARGRLLSSSLDLVHARGLSVRAHLRTASSAPPASTATYAGMNATETRVALALQDLHINFVPENGVLGGKRLDFVLPDYGLVLTLARPNPLARPLYQANGLRLVEFAPSLVDEQLRQHLLDVLGHPLEGLIQ